MANHQTKVYHFWNGKNIDGKSPSLPTWFENSSQKESSPEMRYEVGVDTFSANDLLPSTQDSE